MAYCEHCILCYNGNYIYLLLKLIMSYIVQFNFSSCLRYPDWSRWISVLWVLFYTRVFVQYFSAEILSPGVLYCYPFTLAMVAWLPCTPGLLEGPSYAVSFYVLWSNLEKLFVLTYVHRIPSTMQLHMAIPRLTCTFILRVGVVYLCRSYCI